MALADAVQGARHTAQVITWTDTDGDAQDLTGATITGRIISKRTGTATAIDGVLTVTGASTGEFTWAYGVNDVAAAGKFRVQFVATYADTLSDKTLVEDWMVERAI